MSSKYKWQKPRSRVDLLAKEKRIKSRDVGEAPVAQPPPYVLPVDYVNDDSAINWQDTCKGAYPHRCGFCPLCEWERDVAKWLDLEPWQKKIRLQVPEDDPQWPSVQAAIRALVEYEISGRNAPSYIGPILENLRQGAIRIRRAGTSYRRDREDPLISRAQKINEVAIALMNAYQKDNRWGLDPNECRFLLIVSTDGVLKTPATLQDISNHVGLSPGTVSSVVKAGRKSMTIELAARGLIRKPDKYKGLAVDIDDYKRDKGW